MENQHNSFVKETIQIIRPTNLNKIWNENDYSVIETTDKEGNKLVILQEKESK